MRLFLDWYNILNVFRASHCLHHTKIGVNFLGHEHLKTEKFDYVSNTQNEKQGINFEQVRIARKSEKIGAQHESLKMILKEKIHLKRKEEWLKREEKRKLDNEEDINGEMESAEEEDEEILDDEDMSEEDSEEEEDEEIDWEDEEARLREIDRRNRRKRIKQGSFLDDEAEDDDNIDEDVDNSFDETSKNENDVVNLKTKETIEIREKEKLDNAVSNVIARSTTLPDTEELLEAGQFNSNDSNDYIDKPITGGQIHPKFSKETKRSEKAEDDIELSAVQSTPLTVSKEDAQPNQSINWTPLYSDEASLSILSKTNPSMDDVSMSARKKLGFEELFDTTDPKVDDMDDVIGLCSGQFMTQPNKTNILTQDINSKTQSEYNISQEVCDTPDTMILTENLTGIADTAPDNQSLNGFENYKCAISINQKDEDCDQKLEKEELQPGFMQDDVGALALLSTSDEENEKSECKRLKKKMKKRKRKVLSDDSASDSEIDKDALSNDEVQQTDQREVFYDSEENEIEAEGMGIEEGRNTFKGFKSKKGALRKEFVEQEAELSGESNDELNISEDEDERGLDRLMLEEGDMDEECADEDKLRDQVGRLHHRAVLDDDQREIRLFQEAFLEDGELHSDNTRSRKFRWKDTDGDIELERRASDDEGEDNASLTAQQDEKWRLERLEREKWVKESEIGKNNKAKIREELGGTNSYDEDSDNDDSQFFNRATKALKKLNKSHSTTSNIHKTSSGGGDTLVAIAKDINDHSRKPSKQFKSPQGRLPLHSVSNNSGGSSVRGSFLSRCPSTLEKLAEMTKSSSETRTGTGAKNSKNFVFALLSPKKSSEENLDDGHNKSSGSSATEKCKSNPKGTISNEKGRKPDHKKIKIDRSINENSSDTIFGLM